MLDNTKLSYIHRTIRESIEQATMVNFGSAAVKTFGE
jgi:hypothetical protein